ncbi:MAG: hypothetical protein AABY07_10185 [Nanoarchaeota archaeon]
MARMLDFDLLEFFVPVLVLIFVFLLFYALFEKTKFFGEEKGLHALLALLFAFLFVIVKPLREFITTVTPWFVLFFFLIFILLLTVMIAGFKESDINKYLLENPGITTTAIVVVILIFLLGFNAVFPGAAGFPEDDTTEFAWLRRILFHPKILSFFLVFLIVYFVMRSVGFTSKK